MGGRCGGVGGLPGLGRVGGWRRGGRRRSGGCIVAAGGRGASGGRRGRCRRAGRRAGGGLRRASGGRCPRWLGCGRESGRGCRGCGRGCRACGLGGRGVVGDRRPGWCCWGCCRGRASGRRRFAGRRAGPSRRGAALRRPGGPVSRRTGWASRVDVAVCRPAGVSCRCGGRRRRRCSPCWVTGCVTPPRAHLITFWGTERESSRDDVVPSAALSGRRDYAPDAAVARNWSRRGQISVRALWPVQLDWMSTAISPPRRAPAHNSRSSPLQNRPASYQFGLRPPGSNPIAW